MYDLIIIGGGPAGYLAAERAGAAGLKTLLAEKRQVGGVCLNEGCVPTKTFLYSAKLKDGAVYGEKYGVSAENIKLNHETVLARKNKVVAALVGGVRASLKNAGVETVIGEAFITGRNAEGFEVKCADVTHTSKMLLVATGSMPILPGINGLKEAYESGFAVTSKEMLDIREVPKSLAIIGGGVIGLEMASYFKSAGSDVTVIEMLPAVGGSIDSNMAAILKRNLEKKGIAFEMESKVTALTRDAVIFENSGGIKEKMSSLVLLSIGRRANTAGIGLENIGVDVQNGAIKTDEYMKTNIPNVYAAGDVNGRLMLAHTAYREAEVAVNNMTGKRDVMSYNAIPYVIYTNPEVAGAGETEESAKAKGMDITVKSISMRYSGRYMAENEGGDGTAKIIIDNRYRRIIGFHMAANYASEIIYGACMMIEKEMTLESIKKTVFPHPTVSEIIREIIFQI